MTDLNKNYLQFTSRAYSLRDAFFTILSNEAQQAIIAQTAFDIKRYFRD